MPNGGSHAADLTIFAFDEFQTKPAGRDSLSKANWRDAGRNFGLGIEKPGAAR
jgi:hypothetical protein